jgi:exosortase
LSVIEAALAAAALVWSFRGAIESYLRDQHYQEHFLYLWVFFGLALTRSLRPPFRSRYSLTDSRDRLGLAMVASAWLLFAASQAVGSSTLERGALVCFLTGCSTLAVPGWRVRRCVAFGLLMQFCFGLPYAVYFPLTAHLQWGVAQFVALPARLGLADYVVRSPVVLFPDYQLVITPDCSGLGQLLTFVGIAALGLLTGRSGWRRCVWLLVVAGLLAWVSNLARVGMFVCFVAVGWTASVDDPTWHAILGFLVFLPFVTLLIGIILKTHVALPVGGPVVVSPGRWRVAWLVAPMLGIQLALAHGEEVVFPAPDYFARIERPPTHRLELHGPTEAEDRISYGTNWLLNARFRAADGGYFDLFHYATRSRSHLCVHKIVACLGVQDRRVRYEPAVQIAGRSWWRIDIAADDPALCQHVYFAFEVGGRRMDDSPSTQLAVFWRRLLGSSWEVRLTRVMMPGPLPPVPDAQELAVLGWLGELTGADG